MAAAAESEKMSLLKRARASLASARRSKPAVLALTSSVVVLLLLYGAALVFLSPSSPGKEVTLDVLIKDTAAKKVQEAKFLDEDARIEGTVAPANPGAPPMQFWTSYPRSDAATNDLLQNLSTSGAKVSVDSQSTKALVRFVAQFLLPLVILANLFALLFYLARGGGGASEFLVFGKVGDKRLRSKSGQPTHTFADVASAEEEIAELAEVRDYLADPSAFEAMGALPPKGVLLVGPPGCGKTLLARSVAGEAQANFFSISGSEFVESLVGVGAARVRDLFAQARAAAPAIIFIDELDGAGRRRGAGLGGGHDEREQTLNELLVQMDGFSPTEGVVVMGATNRPDILDPALLRPGRFDRRIAVDHPDTEGRLAILRLHAKSRRLENPEVDLSYIARHTAGFTGADLANVINEAALLAVRWRSQTVGRQHLDEAVERAISGPRRAAKIIPEDEKRRIATHEAGHVIVAQAMGKAASIDKVSIVARGQGVGHLAMLSEDKSVLTRADMEAQITIAMAGVAAEELVLGQPSTGSEQDLERATNTARDMAGRYGMSARLGRVRVLKDHGEVFLGRDYMASQDVSQPTLENLDAEVRRILDEEEAAASKILSAHRSILELLASALMSQETLQGPDLDRALRGIKPYLKVAKTAPRPRKRSAASS
jgi:cell division protease FtsH